MRPRLHRLGPRIGGSQGRAGRATSSLLSFASPSFHRLSVRMTCYSQFLLSEYLFRLCVTSGSNDERAQEREGEVSDVHEQKVCAGEANDDSVARDAKVLPVLNRSTS